MFVSRKKYDQALFKLDQRIRENLWLLVELGQSRKKCLGLMQRIVELTRDATRQACNEQFSQDEIKSLLMLVHPDKHNGKESAKVMTQKLLRMRK